MLALVALIAAASPELDRAIADASRAYQAAEWDTALAQLAKADAHASTESERVLVWLYTGCVLANVPDLNGATAAWSKALAIDPDAKPPVKLAPKSLAEFERLKVAAQRMRDAVKQHTAQQLDTPLKSPALVPPTPAPAPVVEVTAQRKRPHLISFIALGVTAVVGINAGSFGIFSRQSIDLAKTSTWADEKAEALGRAQQQATVANVLFAVTGGLALATLLAFIFL